MATAWGCSAAPFVSSGLVQTPLDRVSANAATPPMTDSQLLPAPPPAAMLPPPPPARDLHGARARITLEKVKLEIESVREVLGDVNGLGEAVKGLRNQVELLLAERAAQDEALEARVKGAVQTACQEHSSKIKADLEAVSRRLSPASVDPNKSRNSYNLRAADNLEATLRKDVEERFAQFETLLGKRLGSGGADGRHSVQLGELRSDIESLSRTVDRQAEVVRRLQGEVVGLGKRFEEKANGELKQHTGGASHSANPPLGVQVTPTPALSSIRAADLTITAERRTVIAPAIDDKSTTASSPSLPRPSPPRRKVPLRQLANSVIRPDAGTSPLHAANDGEATCAGTLGSVAPGRAAHVGPFRLARPRETSTTTTRMRIFSPERQTPSRRRLLEPSEALTSSACSSRTKTTTGPSPTMGAEEERRSIMQQQQQAAKRRRTIKQDESQGSSLAQQGEEEGYDLMSDVVHEQGGGGEVNGRGEGAAAEEEHGSSSEGEPSTQE